MDGPLSRQGTASGKLSHHEREASGTDALTTVQKVFGYEAFRLGQEAIFQTVLQGQNALAVMPTGSGKSPCFQILVLVVGWFDRSDLATAGLDAGSISLRLLRGRVQRAKDKPQSK